MRCEKKKRSGGKRRGHGARVPYYLVERDCQTNVFGKPSGSRKPDAGRSNETLCAEARSEGRKEERSKLKQIVRGSEKENGEGQCRGNVGSQRTPEKRRFTVRNRKHTNCRKRGRGMGGEYTIRRSSGVCKICGR